MQSAHPPLQRGRCEPLCAQDRQFTGVQRRDITGSISVGIDTRSTGRRTSVFANVTTVYLDDERCSDLYVVDRLAHHVLRKCQRGAAQSQLILVEGLLLLRGVLVHPRFDRLPKGKVQRVQVGAVPRVRNGLNAELALRMLSRVALVACRVISLRISAGSEASRC